MNWLVSIFTSSGFGAVTGLVGGWLAKREARKMEELRYNHEAVMAKFQAEEAKAERDQALALGEQNKQLAEIEGQQRVEEKTVDAFKASMESQGKTTGNALFDFVLRLVRPIITVWLLVLLGGIYGKLDELTGGLESLSAKEQLTLYMTIVDAIIFLTTTAVGWWFASRRGQIGK